MNAVIYARVSTEDQGDNFSIPSQFAAARRYAEERDWRVVAELSDTMSGAVLERPALRRMRDLLAARAVDVVIVYALDRLSRNVAHMLLLRDEMSGAGVQLHAVTRGQSAETAEGRLFDTVESAFAEFERLKIRERSMRGKRQKVAEGRVLGQGVTPPYGYRYTGNKRTKALEPDATEAEWVRRIFAWTADGVSSRAIAARLEEAGVAPPGNTRHKAAAHWYHGTVQGIIRNPVYRGEQVYDAYNTGVAVPALVDAGLWQRANEQLDRNKQNACRVAKRFYALRTRVRCACGNACGGNPVHMRGVVYRYYTCIGKDKEAVRRCAKPAYVRAERLEAAVWQWVSTVVLDEARLMDAIEQATATEADRRRELERERAAYAAHIGDADRRIARLIDAYTAGALDLDAFTGAKRQYDAMKSAAHAELARIDTLLADDAARRVNRDALLETVRNLKAAPASLPTPEEQAAMYDALDLRVVVDGETAQVSARLTGDEGVLPMVERRSLSACRR